MIKGSNLLCYSDLTWHWRLGDGGALQDCLRIHPDRLKKLNALGLVAERVREPLLRHWVVWFYRKLRAFVSSSWESTNAPACRTVWHWQCRCCATLRAKQCTWRHGEAQIIPSATVWTSASPACCG